jgi:hypothetical protein
MFRGQGQDWPLDSSLHRLLARFGHPPSTALEIEHAMMREFRRRYSGPDERRVVYDGMYCLAKMQHYGAPTRLLDWSYSFFVALFFAIESADVWFEKEDLPPDRPESKPAVIWAFQYDWIKQKCIELKIDNKWRRTNIDENRASKSFLEDEYMKRQDRMVFAESALPLNGRLANQQGVFLLSGLASESVDQVFNSLIDKPSILWRIELQLSAEAFSEVVTKLNRMRMRHSTIYADSNEWGRDLVMQIPALRIRTRRVIDGEFKNPGQGE